MDSDLGSTLKDIVDLAEATSGDAIEVRLGPVPLTVRSAHHTFLDQVSIHDLGHIGSAPWRSLTAHLIDGSQLDPHDLPVPMQPSRGPGPRHIFRSEQWIGVADTELLWVVDMEQGRAVRWSHTANDVPVWETAKPLRFALKAWSLMHDAVLLHAAALAGPHGATLLVGPGGTGKSTSAFSCLGTGLHVLADDYCLVGSTPGATTSPTVHPTYMIGNLDDHSLALLPEMRARVRGIGPKNKHLVALDPLPITALDAPVRSLCTIERRPGERTRLEPISRAEGMRLLAPSTVMQLPGLNSETWDLVSRVVRTVDTYRLIVGNLDEVADVLGEHLGEATPC